MYLTKIFLLAVLSVQNIDAYVLHDSCNQINNKTATAIERAFASADGTLAQISTGPMDSGVQRLLQSIFKNYPEERELLKDSYSQISNLNKPRIYDEFLLNRAQWPYELVIYCDQRHLKNKTYTDMGSNKKVSGLQDPWYIHHSTSCEGATDPPGGAYAWVAMQNTSFNGLTVLGVRDENITLPDVLYLCDWYVTRQERDITSNLSAIEWRASRTYIGLNELYDGLKIDEYYTQMDLFKNLQHTIFREIAHTALGRRAKSGTQVGRELIPSGNWRQAVKTKDPRNPDLLAFLATAIEIMSHRRYEISEHGDLTKVETTSTQQSTPTG